MSEIITERQYLAMNNHRTLLNIRALMFQLMVYGMVEDGHLFDDVRAIHDALDRMTEHYAKHSPSTTEPT